mmetsp:Transcript_27591/g.40603  ORF Transcript_27591/g.40603 Transcript_27591/m.40603 type:complete len:353 (+) Transcript_27591:137-1195(+)
MRQTIPSFEEFHTARKRQRAMEHAEKVNVTKPPRTSSPTSQNEEGDNIQSTKITRSSLLYTKNVDSSDSSTDRRKATSRSVSQLGSRISLGQLLELPEVQLVTIALIYLNLIATTLEALLSKQSHTTKDYNVDIDSDDNHHINLLNLLQSFIGFTLFFFLVELMILLFTFRSRFFGHFGYVLDLFILIICFGNILSGSNYDYVRLLGFARVWRMARLVSSTLDVADCEHNVTKGKLFKEEQNVNNLRKQLVIMEESKENEKDIRKKVEGMLQGYKDEVETLTEALKIAAYDVANDAYRELELCDQSSSENEEKESRVVFVDEDGDEFYDNGNDHVMKEGRIVVHEDGSYELR